MCVQEKFAAKGSEIADLQLSHVSCHDKLLEIQPTPNFSANVQSCTHTHAHVHTYTLYSQISSQLDTFRVHLEEFARRHKNDIRKDPNFRGHFQQMCARIGVDPLACETLGLVLQPGSCGGCSEMGVGRVAAFYTQITIQRKNSFACNYTKMTGGSCVVHPFFHTHVQLVKVFGLKH